MVTFPLTIRVDIINWLGRVGLGRECYHIMCGYYCCGCHLSLANESGYPACGSLDSKTCVSKIVSETES